MKKEDLIIVNINDIEDIVLAKYKLDTTDPTVEGRSDLNEFMQKYCVLNDIAVINEELKPFKFINKFNMSFLFISNTDDKDIVIQLLEKYNYNLNTLKEVKFEQMLDQSYLKDNIMLIRNNKYYNL